MSIYYKYAPYGTKIVVLSYVYDCVYWYTYETIGKWFVDALEIYSMRASWDIHIGSCQSECLI